MRERVALTAAANLAGFSVTLVDLYTSLVIANELAGQTIRFATGGQAERAIIVEGVDDNGRKFYKIFYQAEA